MRLETNDVHIWSTELDLAKTELTQASTLLSTDEMERADRFRLPLHRERFIAARAFLRTVLSLYLENNPQTISFSYSPEQKPILASANPQHLQFNLAHSDNRAVCALTLKQAIGIDIEKIRATYPEKVAKRFFNAAEYEALQQYPETERPQHFFRLWCYKEALVKAIGGGLSIPLATLKVSLTEAPQTITYENIAWCLLPVFLYQDCQCAIATNQVIKSLSYHKINEL